MHPTATATAPAARRDKQLTPARKWSASPANTGENTMMMQATPFRVQRIFRTRRQAMRRRFVDISHLMTRTRKVLPNDQDNGAATTDATTGNPA